MPQSGVQLGRFFFLDASYAKHTLNHSGSYYLLESSQKHKCRRPRSLVKGADEASDLPDPFLASTGLSCAVSGHCSRKVRTRGSVCMERACG